MTSVLAHDSSKRKRIPGRSAIIAARVVLFWEKFWPAILPALGIPFAYLFISLCDLWRYIPVWAHSLGLILGACGFGYLIFRDLRGIEFPSRRDAQARLEADGGVTHAALQALDDQPFTNDENQSPLWKAHLADMRERAAKARLGSFDTHAYERDPLGLRFIALGLLWIGFIAAGDQAGQRIALGLAPTAHGGSGALVADLWIEPPAYANRAPIYLLRAGETPPKDITQIDTPEGSLLVAQINGTGRAKLSYRTERENIRPEINRSERSSRTTIALGESGLLELSLNGNETSWPIAIIGDTEPLVSFAEPPARTDDARLAFSVLMEDDYGVRQSRLVLRLDPDQERPLDSPAFTEAALEERRHIPLEGVMGRNGEHQVTLDLQSDPWAGLQVFAKVIVTDGAGQNGETEEALVTLPARLFYNPIAKSVIEQRQTLSVAADQWKRAARSFDAITLAPDIFYKDKPKDFLLLRSAFWRVMRQNDDGFDDAVEKFWPLALQLEDEALELARQRLEAAQEALRQALERGASDAEIERLVEELRQAMNDYLMAMAQSGQSTDGQMPQDAQQLERSDLDDMLDAIRDLSEQGASNAARQMLSELENMLNNLRMSQSGSGGSGRGQPGESGEASGGAAGQAGELIGRQRELADEAFQQGQSGGGNGDALAGEEGELGQDLDALIDELSGNLQADPNGEAGQALSRARNAMREAENALRGDDFGAASDAMERAIAGLREGADQLAREQRRQANGESGPGEDGQRGPATDPLGRPAGQADGDGVEVPGLSEAGKTRAVIDELRKRLGQPDRDESEVEYLERLLERF
ncbi:DUF4175 family protein [Hyphococcus formosus]|uniref:DUF4175 domain-containing protein n=1 Tax=Hyphococcus formosus TaxID=3143534 RepID=UPI00398B15AF